MSDSRPVAPNAAIPSVGVALVSKGRPEILDATLASVFRQTLPPTEIAIVVPTDADLPRQSWGPSVQLITGFKGLCLQRNRAIDAISTAIDYVAFFDDDFELKTDYLAEAVAFLEQNRDAVALSGLVIADGKISREEARQRVDEFRLEDKVHFQSSGKFHSLYGCNMVVRRALLEQVRFDENLPLYAFGEDYDFSVRVERHGPVGKLNRSVGVHLAAAGGRVSEVQRGYSFVANPYYFCKKGSTHLSPVMTWVRFWAVSVGRTCGISMGKLVTRDRSTDWAGRLKGSLLAVKDILLGRSHPKRVEEI